MWPVEWPGTTSVSERSVRQAGIEKERRSQHLRIDPARKDYLLTIGLWGWGVNARTGRVAVSRGYKLPRTRTKHQGKAKTMSIYFTSLSLLATSVSSPVDTMRQSLIDKSDRWFFWLVMSSIVVGIGVCLEAPESTIALKRWFRHWRKETDVPPENERSLAIPASYLGLLLVILGVAGKGYSRLFQLKPKPLSVPMMSRC